MPDDVVLSDGKECHVETLGIYELDSIPLPNLGSFTYEMEMVTGDMKEVELDLTKFEELPEKPDIPESEIVEGTPAWYRLRTWQLVQAALMHNRRRIESADEYAEQILDLILNKCIAEEDVPRIKTIDDFRLISWEALVPPLSREMLAVTLRTTFNASFNDEDIFDAMDSTSGGLGSYNAIRLWENQLSNLLQIRDWEYAQIPIEERARRVCAMKLPSWLEYLEMSRKRKKSGLPEVPES